ncbi:hypothetical protein P12x_002656 [Tundrisphaera lichenicola]|uniref:hypothetical protein n=1 Tax=Tundrisphaera lichenicola TaxID=2029860 RepID=UPI003EBE7964
MDKYKALKDQVEKSGFTVWENDHDVAIDRIVLSRGVEGNSFWVSRSEEKGWILGMWGPAYYLVPDEIDIAKMCLSLLRSTRETLPDVNAAFKRKFKLKQIPESDW